MPGMHLRQLTASGKPGFTYHAWGPFTKSKEKIQKFKETGDSQHILLDKACFQHDMAYWDFKILPIRTASNKALCDKAFNVAKNLKYDGYQRWLASMVYKFFDQKSASPALSEAFAAWDESSSGSSVESEIMSNQRKILLKFTLQWWWELLVCK